MEEHPEKEHELRNFHAPCKITVIPDEPHLALYPLTAACFLTTCQTNDSPGILYGTILTTIKREGSCGD